MGLGTTIVYSNIDTEAEQGKAIEPVIGLTAWLHPAYLRSNICPDASKEAAFK